MNPDLQVIKLTDTGEIEKCRAARKTLNECMDKLKVLEATYQEEKNDIVHQVNRTFRELWFEVAPNHFVEFKKIWTAGSATFIMDFLEEFGDVYIRRDRSVEKDFISDESSRPPGEILH